MQHLGHVSETNTTIGSQKGGSRRVPRYSHVDVCMYDSEPFSKVYIYRKSFSYIHIGLEYILMFPLKNNKFILYLDIITGV